MGTSDPVKPSKKFHGRQEDKLTEHTKVPPGLKISDMALVQKYSGPHTTRWDRLGTMVVIRPHDQYMVNMDGSGTVTLRNKRFFEPITAYTSPPTRS
jgi:hypothetical protein